MNPLEKLFISQELLRSIGEIDEFKGKWEALGNLAPERLSSLHKIATIESVGSSTRIEGVRLSDQQIERLLQGLDIRSLRTRDEQEVAGYAELMELVFGSFSEIPLTENHIRQLHGVLLKFSTRDEHHRGEYKHLPNNVEAFDQDGRSAGIIFETALPFDTPRLMQALVDWTRAALASPQYHPLMVIGVFVVRFLAIHPFQDGNGRLSRVLTTLLLLRAGYGYVPYCSLEKITEDNKEDYYRALRRAQATLGRDDSQLHEWISFFVRCLVLQKDKLAKKIESERVMSPLAPLSEKLLAIVREHSRVTIRQAAALTGAKRDIIKVHLKNLVKAGQLVLRGRGRGTWYEKA